MKQVLKRVCKTMLAKCKQKIPRTQKITRISRDIHVKGENKKLCPKRVIKVKVLKETQLDILAINIFFGNFYKKMMNFIR